LLEVRKVVAKGDPEVGKVATLEKLVLYDCIAHFVGETVSVVVLAGAMHVVELHASMATMYRVPGAAPDWILTLIPLAVLTHPVPFHVGVGDVLDGHFTTESEENPGRFDVSTKCTPPPDSWADPPDQWRLTLEPGTTAKDES
jgi:hypothetical protein